MDLHTGIELVQGPVLASHHVLALQKLGKACWRRRDDLVQWDTARDGTKAAPLFTFIGGHVLQVDVDRCSSACTRTRSTARFFTDLLGVDAEDVLRACQGAYDAFYMTTLAPAAHRLYGAENQIFLQPGRKLLLSGNPGEAQLLHLDSLWPTLVGNVYLRPLGSEMLPLRATHFSQEDGCSGMTRHPRDLRILNIDDSLGRDSIPWDKRADVGPGTVLHNSAVLFCGNVVHGGPAPESSIPEAEPRIVMFQQVRPASSPDQDLSDYQEFEFSLFQREYGASLATRRALRATRGRWREHVY